jgi:hypothetical protein
MTMANKVNERIGDTKSVAEAFVILSAATSSHGEEVAESKEPYCLFERFGLSRSQHKIAGVCGDAGRPSTRLLHSPANGKSRSG